MQHTVVPTNNTDPPRHGSLLTTRPRDHDAENGNGGSFASFRRHHPYQAKQLTNQIMSIVASSDFTDAMPPSAAVRLVYIWLTPTTWPFSAVSVK